MRVVCVCEKGTQWDRKREDIDSESVCEAREKNFCMCRDKKTHTEDRSRLCVHTYLRVSLYVHTCVSQNKDQAPLGVRTDIQLMIWVCVWLSSLCFHRVDYIYQLVNPYRTSRSVFQSPFERERKKPVGNTMTQTCREIWIQVWNSAIKNQLSCFNCIKMTKPLKNVLL